MTIYTYDGETIGAKCIEPSFSLKNLIIDEFCVVPIESVARIVDDIVPKETDHD